MTLSPSSLLVSLAAISTTTLAFQALLHSYLRLPASVLPPAVTAESLTGLTYVDKVRGGAKDIEDRQEVKVDGPNGEVDRVYYGAPDELALTWEGGEARVVKSGLADVVVRDFEHLSTSFYRS